MIKIPNDDTKKEAFEARLSRHEFHWCNKTKLIHGDFFYLPWKNGRPTTDEFLTYLASQAINYAIPFHQREEMYNTSGPSDLTKIMLLKKKMRDLFLTLDTSGEFGELILYLILRDFFDAPQIVCKMSLKTNPNVPFFGADALHVGFNGNTMILYHGESKMFAESKPTNAIKQSINSSESFLTNEKLKNGARARDFEVNLISSHFSIPNCSKEQKEMILNYLNPLKREYNNSKDVAVCLIGFDMDFYKEHYPIDNIEAIFKKKYKKTIDDATVVFESHVDAKSLSQYNFHFILLPFESIAVFRLKFLERLNEM